MFKAFPVVSVILEIGPKVDNGTTSSVLASKVIVEPLIVYFLP